MSTQSVNLYNYIIRGINKLDIQTLLKKMLYFEKEK